MFPLRTKCLGKRVCQPERDELREARFIAMRQITALISAAKTLLGILRFWWRRPAALALDQVAHAGIVRRSGTTRFRWLAHAKH